MTYTLKRRLHRRPGRLAPEICSLAAGMALGSTWLVLCSATAASICARIFYPALAASLPALARSRQELGSANAVMSGTRTSVP